MAVCQPTVPALAAVALMAEQNNPAQPPTMTLMAGPIDTRIQPTEVNNLATSKPIEWFERNVISTVPLRYRGAMRKVYPGFLQISAFMSMNIGRHVNAFLEYYSHLVRPDEEKADAIRVFYEEYCAIIELPLSLYLQTVKNVFQEHQLARGVLQVNEQLVDCSKIKHTALFTIEGERDDILFNRADASRPGFVFGHSPVHEKAPCADGSWPLWCFQSLSLGKRNLSNGARLHSQLPRMISLCAIPIAADRSSAA